MRELWAEVYGIFSISDIGRVCSWVWYQRVGLSLQLVFIGYGLFVELTMSIIVISVSDSHLTTAPKDIMLTY